MRGRRGGNVPVRRGPGEEAEAAAVRPARGARPLVARGAARRWWRRRGRVLPRLLLLRQHRACTKTANC